MSGTSSVLAGTENNIMVRAKMKCSEIASRDNGGGTTTEVVKLSAVYGDDNKPWSQYTPQASVELHITNPEATKQFAVGGTYFVDFTPATAETG